jgi:hypothetical protein
MNTLPYEIKEYIMDYIFDITGKTQKAKMNNILQIRDIFLLNKEFYNMFMSYINNRYNTIYISEFFNKRYHLCIICQSDKSLHFGNRFCKKCFPKLNLITLTDARNNYFLADSDLDKLNSVEKNNLYRKSMIMTLYMEREVKEYALKKHTEEGLEELHNKRNHRKNVRLENEKIRECRRMEIIRHFSPRYKKYIINDILDNEDVAKYISKGVPKPQKRKDILFESIETRLASLKLIHDEYERQQSGAKENVVVQNIFDQHDICGGDCVNTVSPRCINQQCGKHCSIGCQFHKN